MSSLPSSPARLLPDSGHMNRFLLHGTSVLLLWGERPRPTHWQVSKGDGATNVHDVFERTETGASASGEPWVPSDSLHTVKEDMARMISDKQGEKLLRLYFDHIYPALPVLSRECFLEATPHVELRSMAVSLLASLYATALPFVFNDDYLNSTLATAATSSMRNHLYRISWQAISTEAQAPSLSTLQACLLLLQCGPTDQYRTSSPFRPALTKFTVSLATTLGINRDCSQWTSLPLWERRLRLRLWWMTYITDAWAGIEHGTVGSIRSDDFDVPLSQFQSMNLTDGTKVCEPFHRLVHLTRILSDIQESFYTVKATKRTSQHLLRSLEIARPIHARLVEWKSEYIATGGSIGNGSPTSGAIHTDAASLSLCYYAVGAVLFRALLRPLENAADPNTKSESLSSPAANAVVTGALSVAREALTFIEQAVALRSPWNCFWYSWAQTNFANVTMFVVQLHLDMQRLPDIFTTIDDGSEDLTDANAELFAARRTSERARSLNTSELITRWRQAIRLGVGSGGWGSSLMSLALLRMDAVLADAGRDQKTGRRFIQEVESLSGRPAAQVA